jgi:DNA mismatch repair protein MutS
MEEKLTPMMQQYLSLKQELKDEVLFFRMGDFYEMFMDDAQEVSRILNITLTARNGVPMCGIPYHAMKNYLKRLLDAGKKIAVSEQVEMPDSTRALARREIVQIITPGTVVDDEFLDASRNNFILCVGLTKKEISCSYCDLSSGQFSLVVLDKDTRWESLRALYEELAPRELLIHEDDYLTDISFAKEIDQMGAMKTKLPSWYFSIRHGYDLLKEQSETLSLKPFGIEEEDIALLSAGALLHYLKDTSKTSLSHLTFFQRINRDVFLQIDEASRKNLEIITNLQDGTSARTLFSSVDSTRTAAGARQLKRWLSSPLAEIEAIVERQNHVQWYLDDSDELQRVRQILGNTLDIMRLTTRVAMKRAIPQDLVSIEHSLRSFFTLLGQHTVHYRELASGLQDTHLEELVDLMEILSQALQDDCQGPFVAGEVIRNGFNDELDRLRQLRSKGSSKLQQYLENLKKETGIPAMKLSYNRIIGHYLEISKTQENKIPASFYRKQTLVNAERYTTEELMAFEKELLACENDAEMLEKNLFAQLIEKTESLIPQLTSVGTFFSTIDCFQSLATIANRQGYCRPEIVDDDILQIQNGRHPVVEQMLPIGSFVANPLDMIGSAERFCLITGPNMAGKSTYLRQNALIVLLAQIGSYVPATNARIGLTDKLFCRVGASDNLARGESTFLIEMQEAAFILRTASQRSLVIMDEIGRGTSTQDGMSLAYAMMQYLMEKNIKTLFATHYHELTMFDNQNLQLLTLEVAESQHKIVFLRRLRKGVANSSYGLHVAKMAGIPAQVIRSAAQFQKKHFHDYTLGTESLQLDLFRGDDVGLVSQGDPSFETPLYSKIIDRIMHFPLEESTPIQSMGFLEELRNEITESFS